MGHVGGGANTDVSTSIQVLTIVFSASMSAVALILKTCVKKEDGVRRLAAYARPDHHCKLKHHRAYLRGYLRGIRAQLSVNILVHVAPLTNFVISEMRCLAASITSNDHFFHFLRQISKC